jgi:hypothetical protein
MALAETEVQATACAGTANDPEPVTAPPAPSADLAAARLALANRVLGLAEQAMAVARDSATDVDPVHVVAGGKCTPATDA